MSHTRKLRKIAVPFVVAPPGGARARTRLMVDDRDAEVLEALGAHLGQLASSDLARRVKEGSLDA
ncbi:MAG: IS200/IS605 family accessory protein TnpB-related protein, partial [Acidimicrobiales bacterium]